MALEIERKFLVRGDGWRRQGGLQVAGVRLVQGYLNRDPHRTVRVRTAGEQAWLTVKGLSRGATRVEFEYAVPLADAQAMLTLCDGPLIDKTRYTLTVGTTTWEVDEFHGENDGLVVAEVELASESQTYDRPEWVGDEVTHDARYFNSSLAKQPYRVWRENC